MLYVLRSKINTLLCYTVVLGIGIARGQYYWILDIGCLVWYRSNPTFNWCVLHMFQCNQEMNRVVADTSHVQQVRRLYKLILRLHRGLPGEMKSVGDDYVRAEFRRHKDAEPQFVPVFMHEWMVKPPLFSRVRTILVLGYWVLGNIHRYWAVSLLGDIFCCSDT